MFLGNIYESLDYYLKGIRYSPDIWMIETTLKTLNNLNLIKGKLEGFDLVKQILHLGILFHPNLREKTDKILRESTKILNTEISQKQSFSDENIVIIAGGTDERFERDLMLYRNTLIEAFRDFKGTIISGGTKSGISGIVGDIQETYLSNIKTVGYTPANFPAHIEIDKRFSAIHTTKGTDFSYVEPIQYWYDLMKSGIESNKVKLIGINGGKISAFEFHAAIVFGAQIGIMESSGRAAFDLINDPSWEEPLGKEHDYTRRKLFKILKNSSEDIYNFLTKPFIIDPDINNIQKLLIQYQSSGIDMYEFSFSLEDVDNTLLSGFLNALDSIATQALNVGDILSIKFREGYLTGGFFNNGEFKVVFLLNEIPSKSLENKIIKYIKKVEEKMGDTFNKLRLSCQSYSGGEEMNNILSKVFGSEILKLLGNVAKK